MSFPGPDLFPGGTLFPSGPDLDTATELKMLAELPEVLQGSTDYRAVIRACARETDLLEASLESLRAQFNPATADVLLPAWEAQLKLPVVVPGERPVTIDERRARVLARLRKVLSGGQGREWEAALTNILGVGWSYLEHDPANPSSPAPGVIQITVPFASGSSQFIEAQEQVRELTDAHLQIVFASTAPFRLDLSELDVSEFGT